MTKHERAQRIAAWTWAAETLDIEVLTPRMNGLIQTTARVRVENLQPALQAALESDSRGFLPAPGAVIDAANRIAGVKREQYEIARRQRHRREAMIEANASPLTPEQMDEIRQKIAQLAGGGRTAGSGEKGWRPADAIRPGEIGKAGLAAVREITGL